MDVWRLSTVISKSFLKVATVSTLTIATKSSELLGLMLEISF